MCVPDKSEIRHKPRPASIQNGTHRSIVNYGTHVLASPALATRREAHSIQPPHPTTPSSSRQWELFAPTGLAEHERAATLCAESRGGAQRDGGNVNLSDFKVFDSFQNRRER